MKNTMLINININFYNIIKYVNNKDYEIANRNINIFS